MASFSLESERELAGVHPALVSVCRRAITFMDFKVIQGPRTLEESMINVGRGTSRLKDPSKSKHLIQPDGFGHAVDLAPWPVNWEDSEMFCVLAGVMRVCAALEDVTLRWGGDWNRNNSTVDERFRDYGHFELILPLTRII